jgi:hypothetical protein
VSFGIRHEITFPIPKLLSPKLQDYVTTNGVLITRTTFPSFALSIADIMMFLMVLIINSFPGFSPVETEEQAVFKLLIYQKLSMLPKLMSSVRI